MLEATLSAIEADLKDLYRKQFSLIQDRMVLIGNQISALELRANTNVRDIQMTETNLNTVEDNSKEIRDLMLQARTAIMANIKALILANGINVAGWTFSED
jgi:hypothetical protein